MTNVTFSGVPDPGNKLYLCGSANNQIYVYSVIKCTDTANNANNPDSFGICYGSFTEAFTTSAFTHATVFSSTHIGDSGVITVTSNNFTLTKFGDGYLQWSRTMVYDVYVDRPLPMGPLYLYGQTSTTSGKITIGFGGILSSDMEYSSYQLILQL